MFTFTCLERSLLPDEWKPFNSRFILSIDGDGRDGVHLVTEAELRKTGPGANRTLKGRLVSWVAQAPPKQVL
ncbi:hypothetical protein OIU76_001548 [Salix suchowensis]|nr:hypothetical protein OIU76_001548 [Salix suchowensis]